MQYAVDVVALTLNVGILSLVFKAIVRVLLPHLCSLSYYTRGRVGKFQTVMQAQDAVKRMFCPKFKQSQVIQLAGACHSYLSLKCT